MSTLVLVVVLGQRLGVPVGSFTMPILVITMCVAALALLAVGLLQPDRLRTELFVIAVAACFLAAYMATWADNPMSTSSLLLLAGMYAPWVFSVQPQLRGAFSTVSATFVDAMLVLSAVGVGQMLTQISGLWEYQDYLAEWIPPQFLVPAYNTSNPIAYLSPIYKANAFVFLEPSFLSQFCALALLVALTRRAPAWQLVLLAAGLTASLSGTGILLLTFGLAVTLFRAPELIRPRYITASAVTLGVILATSIADMLLRRSDEFTVQGSSGHLRFVQPYTEVATGLAVDASRYLFGAGPGTSERLLTSGRSTGEAVVYTIPAKLIFEYGVLAGSLFMLFIVVAVMQGAPRRVLPSALLFMTFLLSGALLQPHTMYLAWLLSSVWGGQPVQSPAAFRTTRPASLPDARGPHP